MSRHVPTFVIDQSALIREGLTRILAGTRFRVSAAYAEIQEIKKKTAPDEEILVLVGSEAHADEDFSELRDFKLEHEGAKIIVLSDLCSARHLMMAVEAGADGFLSKHISSDALLKSLDLVWMGETVIPSALLRIIFDRGAPVYQQAAALAPAELHEEIIADPPPCDPIHINFDRLQRLSCKEQLILRCLTLGASNKAIARELNMAEATVKVHIKGILRKIRVSNRTQAAVWALNRDPAALEGNA
jgi:two-component system, NarL family, nitrate/nitrite response regulator NarL